MTLQLVSSPNTHTLRPYLWISAEKGKGNCGIIERHRSHVRIRTHLGLQKFTHFRVSFFHHVPDHGAAVSWRVTTSYLKLNSVNFDNFVKFVRNLERPQLGKTKRCALKVVGDSRKCSCIKKKVPASHFKEGFLHFFTLLNCTSNSFKEVS